MNLRVIETFSGIGAQAKALERISHKLDNFNYEVVATCEWEIGAMFAYDIIHHGPQDLDLYTDWTKEELISDLGKYTLSSDGKKPLSLFSLKRMSLKQLRSIKHAIDHNKNYVDIQSVHAADLPDADLLTYSFPCQDLSISSFWWNNTSGIDPESGNRSSLLWQIGRLLDEYDESKKQKPRYLLMENVTAIQSPRHRDNFEKWIKLLEGHGYHVNVPLQLNAVDFGIPQNRNRTYMVSVLSDENSGMIHRDLIEYNIHLKKLSPSMDSFLKLDYSIPEYFSEAVESTPRYTDSRQRIHHDSSVLAQGKNVSGLIANTITTKQDRFPNAGIVEYSKKLYDAGLVKSPFRNLTPRETFLLMGFDESDFSILKEQNFAVSKRSLFLSHSKLLKLSGNSIVVNVLESIFEEIIKIDALYFSEDTSTLQKKIV